MKFIQSVIMAACLFIAACDTEKNEAKKALLQSLNDPDSAKFGEFTEMNDKYACFTVNAKNSFGGYVGNQEAFLMKTNGEWQFVIFYQVTHDECVKSAPSQ